MGMSHDFEVAVEEGATMVRVGRYGNLRNARLDSALSFDHRSSDTPNRGRLP
jgi:hypothetical protein